MRHALDDRPSRRVQADAYSARHRLLAHILDIPGRSCCRRRRSASERRTVRRGARLHPPHAQGGTDRPELCLRGLSGRLRGRSARPLLYVYGRRVGSVDTRQRRHIGLHERARQLYAGQHISRRLLGCMAEPLRAVPQPRVGTQGRVRRLQGMALLQGRRHAPARRLRRVDVLPLPQDRRMTDRPDCGVK